MRPLRHLLLLLPTACRGLPPAPPPLEPTAPPAAAPEPSGPRVLARATILAAGDVMMHGQVLREAAAANALDPAGASTNHDGFDALFAAVAPRIRDADLALANLETPVAPDHHRGVREMVFDAPPVLLDALVHAGFDAVSLANNHTFDQRRPGLLETVQRLEASPLAYAGAGADCAAARAPRLMEAGGIRLGLLAATAILNDDLNPPDGNGPCVARLEEARILEGVRAARDQGAEVVILSVHWGNEYRTAPREADTALAHRLLDGGVDVILGHHPHVLQPVEVYGAADGRVTLVAYSLGNFISNQSRWYVHGLHRVEAANTRDGLLLSFDVVRKDYGRGEVRTELAALAAEPLWTVNDVRTRPPEDAPRIQVVPLREALEEARAAAESAEGPARVALLRAAALYEARLAQVARVVGPDLFPPEVPEGEPEP